MGLRKIIATSLLAIGIAGCSEDSPKPDRPEYKSAKEINTAPQYFQHTNYKIAFSDNDPRGMKIYVAYPTSPIEQELRTQTLGNVAQAYIPQFVFKHPSVKIRAVDKYGKTDSVTLELTKQKTIPILQVRD